MGQLFIDLVLLLLIFKGDNSKRRRRDRYIDCTNILAWKWDQNCNIVPYFLFFPGISFLLLAASLSLHLIASSSSFQHLILHIWPSASSSSSSSWPFFFFFLTLLLLLLLNPSSPSSSSSWPFFSFFYFSLVVFFFLFSIISSRNSLIFFSFPQRIALSILDEIYIASSYIFRQNYHSILKRVYKKATKILFKICHLFLLLSPVCFTDYVILSDCTIPIHEYVKRT